MPPRIIREESDATKMERELDEIRRHVDDGNIGGGPDHVHALRDQVRRKFERPEQPRDSGDDDSYSRYGY